MQNLFKMSLFMMSLVLVTSCGKENSTGGGSSSTSISTSTVTDGGQNFASYDELRAFYDSRALNDNLAENTVIYHVGPLFGSSTQQVDTSFSAVLCFNGQNYFGDDSLCSNGYSNGSYLSNMVNNGEYKTVSSATSSSVSYNIATGVQNNSFIFEPKTFDRTDSVYRKMLNIDNKATAKIVVGNANVVMSNGQALKSDLVEYFYSDGTYEAFVIGSNIAVLANPILSIKGSYGTNGVSADVIGELSNIGEITVRSLQATIHRLSYNAYTDTYTVYTQQSLNR